MALTLLAQYTGAGPGTELQGMISPVIPATVPVAASAKLTQSEREVGTQTSNTRSRTEFERDISQQDGINSHNGPNPEGHVS